MTPVDLTTQYMNPRDSGLAILFVNIICLALAAMLLSPMTVPHILMA